MRGPGCAIQGMIVLGLCMTGSPVACAADWPAIPPEELSMQSEPKAPAAPAIYLYRQVDRNDAGPYEINTVRIKVLTEEGRKYADIELPYEKLREAIVNIEARTVHPDGVAVPFEGTTYDKPIALTRGAKFLAKTFTLPDVHVGDVLEYRYKHRFDYGFVFDSRWILSDDLYTRYARFSLIPYRGYPLRYSWPVGLPPGTASPQSVHNNEIKLETRDVPAFVTEEFMPPVNQLMYRVDFVYMSESNNEKDPVKFWKKVGAKYQDEVEKFLDQRRAMTAAVAQIVDPGDSADTKIHKIYARVQRLRNTSFERDKTRQEVDRERLKSAHDVADVWNSGYGNGTQINWLFIALARAAGFQASPVLVSTRDQYFFNANLMNPAELNNDVAVVTVEGRDLYLDPGVAFAPFGELPWSETGVRGLRLAKGDISWIDTPLPTSTESRIERRANLKLRTDGTLEGKVTVTFIGQEALWRRFEERNEDDAERKEFLEHQLAADIPSGVDAQLINVPDWDASAVTLTAQFDLRVPGWAARAGHRLLLPSGLFASQDKQAFLHETRVHPLYFSFTHLSIDDVSIGLPENWQVNGTPTAHTDDRKALVYSFSADVKDGALHSKRMLEVNSVFMDLKSYPVVQDFFRQVRNSDEQQTVLVPPKKFARD